ncbi:high affinity immunoglobulin epsilon receptor subunit gamma-like isoform X1 [Alosa sapidissima]|uniref:high affinity immunoglobulin epsilon receptor subunit gamma-like isoform X1 n=1 Tax=Alosa sapidissima TaxID=34773 RepID=UPI001C084BCE|nr:high affinity immunoglobulin epsilon receptor subunit gamma-like isoform X1 [Alosa sapidissima]
MRMWRTIKLLPLSLMVHVAEATSVSDPVICYVLDAVLLLYCIVFTALYFREKFLRSPTTQEENNQTQEGEGGTYEAVGTQSNPETGAVRRQRAPAADDHYAALQHRTGDTYAQIQNKKKKKDAQASRTQLYESLQQTSADTYNSLEMRPLPPPHPPK